MYIDVRNYIVVFIFIHMFSIVAVTLIQYCYDKSYQMAVLFLVVNTGDEFCEMCQYLTLNAIFISIKCRRGI